LRRDGCADELPSFSPLIKQDDIRRKVGELAQSIMADAPPGEGILVVGVLKAGLLFVADLVRHFTRPVEIELVRVRSYHGHLPASQVEVGEELSAVDARGMHVLLVDTVLDTGRTLERLRELVMRKDPASLKTCVLMQKRTARHLKPDYVGFTIEDVFVVGYGLDYHNCWRHLPYVAAVPEAFLEQGRNEER